MDNKEISGGAGNPQGMEWKSELPPFGIERRLENNDSPIEA